MAAQLQIIDEELSISRPPKPALRPGPLPPEVRGVVCDMGDVLYDASLWRRWLLQLLRRHGLLTNYRAFFRVWDREFVEGVHLGAVDYWDALRAFLTSSGLCPAQIDEITAAGFTRRQAWRTDVRPLPGVVSTFSGLASRGVAMAAIHNSSDTSEQLTQLLRRLCLGGCFQTAFSSRTLGAALPSREIYQAALSALGLRPEQTAFIGHDSAELAGAKQIGMVAIAVNADLDAEADYHLERIEDLSQAFSAASPQSSAR